MIWIVISGIRYLFAGGEPEAAQKARTMLWNGIIGLIIIVGAFIIVETVLKLVGEVLQ